MTVGKTTIPNVPNNSEVVLKNHLKRLKREADECRRLKAALFSGKFNWNPQACQVLGSGLAFAKASSRDMERAQLPLIFTSLFVQANVPLSDDVAVRKACPGVKTIRDLVAKAAKEEEESTKDKQAPSQAPAENGAFI